MESRSNNSAYSGENYTVDEMMDRLKRDDQKKRRQNSSDQDKKIVTREDGTQVVKVRKRKRRTKQAPKKKDSLSPALKWSILGSVVGLILILIVATVFIIAKYNGKSFKEQTEAKIMELSGAQSSNITKLSVTPLSAKAVKYETIWDPNSFLQKGEFNNIRADIKATSFFTKSWIGEEVVASTGKIYIQKPSSIPEPSSNNTESPYDFGSFRCNELNIFFGDTKKAPAIVGLQISQRQMLNEKYQFVFQDGLIKIQNWPELDLSSGVVTLNTQDTEVEALLQAPRGHTGELNISGSIKKSIHDKISLDIKAKDYPIQELLGAELGRIIQGTINSDMGTLSYDYNMPSASGLSCIVPFNSTDISLSGLPFLNTLKDLTGNTKYVHPAFNNCQGSVLRTSDGVSLNNLNWISNSLITLVGNIQVTTDKKLQGNLTVGIPASVLDKNPPKPFRGPQDGLYHADFKLSGTIHNPYDNLHELMELPSVDNSSNNIRKLAEPLQLTPDDQMEKEFDELSR